MVPYKVCTSRTAIRLYEASTTLNPFTIDVMVDSPSKNQKRARYKLPLSGNLFLVRVVIYNKN